MTEITSDLRAADHLLELAVLAELYVMATEDGQPGDQQVWQLQRDGNIIARLTLVYGTYPTALAISMEQDVVRLAAIDVLAETDRAAGTDYARTDYQAAIQRQRRSAEAHAALLHL